MINKIKKNLPFDVLHIGTSKIDGYKMLNIELPDKDLYTIEKKTLIISKIIDGLNIDMDNYYLNVYSSGTEQPIELDNIDQYLEQNIQIKTNKSYLSRNIWEGNLLSSKEDQIILYINNKGHFQKLSIDKNEIISCKLSAKIIKE